MGVGLAVGLIGALVLTRYMEALLFGVTAHDPATFMAISGLLAAVSALACVVPAPEPRSSTP